MIDTLTVKSQKEFIPLNEIQKEAVTYTGGPQLVFAGAGTGKTRVLTAKILYLINRKQIAPSRIFAATFTNKAACEIRNRIESISGINCSNLWIGTFHSLAARILRLESHHLGYIRAFSIFDDNDRSVVLRKIFKEQKIDERSLSLQLLSKEISNYKNSCITPLEASRDNSSFYRREIIQLYSFYQKELFRQQAMDFDDLITNLVYIFRNHPEVLDTYQKLFDYILVDEYQDTNRSQFYLVKLLGGRHHNVFVVGDDDQCIYGWRGAEIKNILSFESEFTGTKVFILEHNYRSTKNILDFANAAIAPNTKRASKKLRCDNSSAGEPVKVVRYGSDRQEADTVCSTIERLISRGVNAGDIAILFRTNAQSRLFEEALRKKKIPYILIGGFSFYERKEIKDSLAYLRVLVNPMDNVSFERILNVPPRGIGEKTLELLQKASVNHRGSIIKTILEQPADTTTIGIRGNNGIEQIRELFKSLYELLQGGNNISFLLQQALKSSGYLKMLQQTNTEDTNERIDNINELLNAIESWEAENPDKGVADFLQQVSLWSDIDSWNQNNGVVNLMTLHCAKGLEFKHVFLVGLEDGILPSRLNIDDPEKIEEERRLFYVGITRAMKTLECCWACQRWRFGNIVPMKISRFLETIEKNLFVYEDFSQSSFLHNSQIRKKSTNGTSTSSYELCKVENEFSQESVEFRVGQNVRHKDYGQGKVVNVSGFGDDMRMTILFADGVRRRVMAKFANLEPL